MRKRGKQREAQTGGRKKGGRGREEKAEKREWEKGDR